MTMTPLYRLNNILGDGDKSWVELQDMMPQPTALGDIHIEDHIADKAVVNAARVSFLGDTKGDEADKKLLFYLLKNGHTTPFEMVEFKFRVRAPVVVFWQLVRHRTFHLNAQSGRYTPFEEDDVYIPKEWRLQSADNKQGSDGVLDDNQAEQLSADLRLTAALGFDSYRAALDMGVAKEQARLFLPAWCSYYIFICKVDARNLMHFLKLRMDEHAQWEIRQYANAMYEMFKEYMPWAAEAFDLYARKTNG